MGLLHAGAAGCLWVSPSSALLPSIFAFGFGLRWPADATFWYNVTKWAASCGCSQLPLASAFQAFAHHLGLSGLCPPLLPFRPMPITPAVHELNVLFAAADVSHRTVHDVQIQQKISDRLTCTFESRATGNCPTAFQPTNCPTDSFSQTAQGIYISKVTGAAVPPSCTSRLALQLVLPRSRSLLWRPVLT